MPEVEYTFFNVDRIPSSEFMMRASVYEKSAVVSMRVAGAGEHLVTCLQDGLVETERDVPEGFCVVTNPDGEQYAVDPEKFASRYDHVEGDQWKAKGRILAFQNPLKRPIVIDAPWGAQQFGDADCMVACSVDDVDDRYLIGFKEFRATYKPVPMDRV